MDTYSRNYFSISDKQWFSQFVGGSTTIRKPIFKESRDRIIHQNIGLIYSIAQITSKCSPYTKLWPFKVTNLIVLRILFLFQIIHLFAPKAFQHFPKTT